MYCICDHPKFEDSQCYVQPRNIKSKPTIIRPAVEDLPLSSSETYYYILFSRVALVVEEDAALQTFCVL